MMLISTNLDLEIQVGTTRKYVTIIGCVVGYMIGHFVLNMGFWKGLIKSFLGAIPINFS